MGGIGKAVGKVVKSTIGGGLLSGGSETKTPDVVTRDPDAEAKASQQKASESASKLAAEEKRRRKSQSLLSSGGESGNANNNGGKTTLGA